MTRDRFFSILFALYLFSSSLLPAVAENIVPPEDDASERRTIVLNAPTAITSGTWVLNADRHGLEYLWASTQSAGDKSAFWRLTLPEEGIYAVEAWWRQGQNRSDAAKFIIGTSKERRTVKVNQQIRGGQWNLLGNFSFQADSLLFIGLSNDASPGYVVILGRVRLRRLKPSDERGQASEREETLSAGDIDAKSDVEISSAQKEEREVSLRGDDERLRPKEQFQVTIGRSLLNITGELSFKRAFKNNRNLDSSNNRDEAEISPKMELDFNLAFPQGLQFFTEVSFEEEVTFGNEERPESQFQVQLKEAFAEVPSFFHPRLTLSIGRQQLFEPRRWLYSERLDAIRLFVDMSPIGLEFSLSTQRYFIAYASYQVAPKANIAGYVIARKDEPLETESPVWIGVRSFGKIKNQRANIKYWLEGGHVTGMVEQVVGHQRIQGFAFDAGGTYIFRKGAFKPAFTLGYAFGSGDNNADDSVDHNFRQTGLQSNKIKWGGVSNFEYYGVMFDPELSNLHIMTTGIGIRPIEKSSVDLVYHHYLQHKPADAIRDSGLKANPTGLDRDLGHEIDLIIGYKGLKNTKLRFRGGYFIPGPGFDQRDHAFGGSFDLKFAF